MLRDFLALEADQSKSPVSLILLTAGCPGFCDRLLIGDLSSGFRPLLQRDDVTTVHKLQYARPPTGLSDPAEFDLIYNRDPKGHYDPKSVGDRSGRHTQPNEGQSRI
jgi:hypothetical protein